MVVRDKNTQMGLKTHQWGDKQLRACSTSQNKGLHSYLWFGFQSPPASGESPRKWSCSQWNAHRQFPGKAGRIHPHGSRLWEKQTICEHTAIIPNDFFFLFLNPASGELAILSLGIYLNKLKTSVHTKSYVCILSHVWLFGTPWTIARQVPLSMGFPRQDYWSGLPFPTPGDLPNPRTEPLSLVSPALAGEFLTTAPSGKPTKTHTQTFIAA